MSSSLAIAAERANQPAEDYFDLMAEVAATHWWYRGRRDWLAQELGPYLTSGAVAVDVGCGTAESVETLRSLGAAAVVGTDVSLQALGHARRRDPAPPVLEAAAENLPFANGVADVVTSMDVIEHLDDDVVALREYRRVLRPGGILFVTVPAYQFLWSAHDVRAAHRRRYRSQQLRRSVEAAGFVVERIGYYYSFLVPPAVLLRRTPLRRLVKDTDEETSAAHPGMDRLLYLLASAERCWVRRTGIRPPFGLSILCLASKPA
ncbi:MAG: methyltransferase domain-containing protein [Acidimicrobiales bacterium]|nr:methyltransferase domain-containing protein [Acidimicrobiales bacterium]